MPASASHKAHGIILEIVPERFIGMSELTWHQSVVLPGHSCWDGIR